MTLPVRLQPAVLDRLREVLADVDPRAVRLRVELLTHGKRVRE